MLVLGYNRVGRLLSEKEHDAYDVTDERGTNTGGEETVDIAFDNTFDTALGTNTGALTACAVRESCGGESGCGLLRG